MIKNTRSPCSRVKSAKVEYVFIGWFNFTLSSVVCSTCGTRKRCICRSLMRSWGRTGCDQHSCCLCGTLQDFYSVGSILTPKWFSIHKVTLQFINSWTVKFVRLQILYDYGVCVCHSDYKYYQVVCMCVITQITFTVWSSYVCVCYSLDYRYCMVKLCVCVGVYRSVYSPAGERGCDGLHCGSRGEHLWALQQPNPNPNGGGSGEIWGVITGTRQIPRAQFTPCNSGTLDKNPRVSAAMTLV